MMKRNLPLLLLIMAMILLVPACANIVAASPDDSGEIEIILSDYKFEPQVIRLKVGQTVHIKLRNEGDKMHEFMAGRDVQIHGNFTEGFGEDFFAGISPQISGPGMVMGGPEGMDMGGMDMGGEEMDMGEGDMEMEDGDHEDDDHDDGDMEMGEDGDHAEDDMDMEEEGMDMSGDDDHAQDDMAMGEEEHTEDDGHEDDGMEMGEEEMEMEEEHEDDEMNMDMAEADDGHEEDDMAMADADHEEGEEDEHEEEGIAGAFGALQLPEMDAHAGLMIMIDPQMIPAGEVTTITFTVPEDKVGRWQMGCFQERGQHYDDGMDGVIIVEP